ncbi:MAG: CHAD domain-containing protein [Humibacillus sp.]|nr:CHAD domain-containing protein [Humibacillus sp.]MDN5779811.1 CHAD domain-containing protein [Humibacillus sp.]
MSLTDDAAGREPTEDGPVGVVLVSWLEQQRLKLAQAELAARRGDTDGVHDLRVCLRKLRTGLATFRPLVDRSVTDPVRDELRWAGSELGGARDREVVHARLFQLLRSEPEGLLAGPGGGVAVLGALADEGLEQAWPDGAAMVTDTLDSDRYGALLLALNAIVAEPPLTTRAERPARKQATKRIRRDLARVLARAEWVAGASDERARVESLHEVRKAAKRLRYAAEAARPVTGKRVRRLGEAAKDLQKVLGEHHDTWATRGVLRSMATMADDRAESSFTIGRLHGLEQARAGRLERRAQVVLATLTDLADRKHTGDP